MVSGGPRQTKVYATYRMQSHQGTVHTLPLVEDWLYIGVKCAAPSTFLPHGLARSSVVGWE